MPQAYESWGRYPAAKPAEILHPEWRNDSPSATPLSRLPYGLGRSYGDVCLNNQGALIDTRTLRHLIAFDPEHGVLTCEGGATFAEILAYIVPRGWFLPVTPGTKYVTVGGAIANDVHGKNHHRAGSFGRHVRRFELLRSTGERLICSPDQHSDLFVATIGGLGLTGLMTWAEFSVFPIETACITEEKIRFSNLQEFFDLSAASDASHAYTVAWIDSTAPVRALGRGIFMRGNHATADETTSALSVSSSPRLPIPFDMPSWLLSRSSIKIFNALYGHQQLSKVKRRVISYEPFFYPLDTLTHWNRLYGKTGFLQYQCVLPFATALPALTDLFARVYQHGLASFLSVLKVFGDIPSPGLLSFPMAGATLALDVRYEGERTLRAFDEFDELVSQAGGRVYPAKDAHMSAQHFRAWYPQWEAVERLRDPGHGSDFWRRVTQ